MKINSINNNTSFGAKLSLPTIIYDEVARTSLGRLTRKQADTLKIIARGIGEKTDIIKLTSDLYQIPRCEIHWRIKGHGEGASLTPELATFKNFEKLLRGLAQRIQSERKVIK